MIPPRLKNIKTYDDYSIELNYYNGEQKVYNMKKMLEYPFFNRLSENK